MELTQLPLDPASEDAFEQRLRDLAAENGPALQQPFCGQTSKPTQPQKISGPKQLRRGRTIRIKLPRSWHLAARPCAKASCALDTLSEIYADALRQMADAVVDHFEAQHANLPLLVLEYRLGLAPEEDLLKAHHDVAVWTPRHSWAPRLSRW